MSSRLLIDGGFLHSCSLFSCTNRTKLNLVGHPRFQGCAVGNLIASASFAPDLLIESNTHVLNKQKKDMPIVMKMAETVGLKFTVAGWRPSRIDPSLE